MVDPPLCPCHSKPMRWRTDASIKTGGKWRCVAKVLAEHERYNHSSLGRLRRGREAQAARTLRLKELAYRQVRIQEPG